MHFLKHQIGSLLGSFSPGEGVRRLCVSTILLYCCLYGFSLVASPAAEQLADPRPLTEVLDELGRLHGVFFTYDAAKLARAEVNYTVDTEENLEMAIERLLEETGFRYEAFGEKYFVLYEDNRQGRRKSNKLKRKVRQLERLENRQNVARVGRADGTVEEQLDKITALEEKISADRQVSGSVLNEAGEPLVGVHIMLAGTPRGTATDATGRFTLPLESTTGELTFSYLGYRGQRLLVQSGSKLNVRLQNQETELPEVLIVGYGRIDARKATASIGQVETDGLNNSQAINTPHQWLQGRVAGVQVLGGNGDPGAFQSIRIRGGSSMNAGNEPLYVVDGIPVDNTPHSPQGVQPGRNPLNALNPDDIARVSVLKDAAATAIYGSRAANGVVLIETKKTRLYEHRKLTYSSWFSYAKPAGQIDVLDADAYRDLVGRIAPWRLSELGAANTDWQSQVLQPAGGQQHTLSLRAGGEQGSYRFSLGYLNRNGTFGDLGSSRLSSAIYLRRELFAHQLRLELDFKVAKLTDRYSNPAIFSNAYSFDPTQNVYDFDSPWGGYFEYDNDLTIKNPLGELNQVNDESRRYRLLGNLKAHYTPEFLPDLTGTVYFGRDRMQGQRNLYAPATVRYQFATGGSLLHAEEDRNSYLWESYLNYDKRLVDSRLGLEMIAGYTYQHYRAIYPEDNYLGVDIPNYEFGDLPTREGSFSREIYQENRLASFFGRVNLDWGDRYFLTASLRTDGSSRFSPDNRWATFPALSFGWRLTEESFLRNRPDWINDLKLRGGWGLTGNQEIGDFEYLPTYTFGDNEVRFPFGNEYILTARPNAVSTDLKWEQTSSFNLALESSFFANRISTTLEAYVATTNDLLSRVIVPAGSNLSDVVLTNVGSIRNRGLEFSLDAKLIEQKNIRWSLGFNLATNQNIILSLGNTSDNNFRAISTGGISGGTGNTIQIYTVGQPLHAFYVFNHLRDENGNPLRDGLDHNLDGRIDLADIYRDVNEDGVVNDRDRRPYQQPAPRLFGGIQSRFSIGAWGLQTALRFQTGNYVYNNLAANTESSNRILTEPKLLNVPTSLENIGFRSPQFFSDFYVEDASFLRMDAATIDYTATLKSKQNKTPKLKNLRLYLTLQNLFTITRYRGLDPEIGNVSGNPNVPRYGIDDLMFPRSRTILLGLNSTF